jgi:general L-amino acid transport system permease protein
MTIDLPSEQPVAAPGLPGSMGPAEWARRNLYNNWYNALITFAIVAGGLYGIWSLIGWFADADFLILRRNLRVFMLGQFPSDELWRPWASGYLIAAALGFGSGVVWRSAQDDATEKGLPTEEHSWPDMLRRFWAVIAILIVFVSFARTVLPYIGLAVLFVVFVVGRELGRRVPGLSRTRALLLAGLMGLVSFLVLAGTSGLGAMSVGVLMGLWAMIEIRELTGAESFSERMVARVGGLVVGVLVWFVLRTLDLEGFGWDDWGGLHLTLFVTVVGITAGLPLGILLAVGRQSELPVIKSISVLFIEFVRGVPLISLLLFSTFMLPLFIPLDIDIPGPLTRAMIVITAFSAAYISEIVRGGLQAVPRGQVEAAQASGMSAGKVQRFIVLPQALRAVIPAMVGQFISLFKDTSLLSVIGLLEFLQASAVANAQTEFLGQGLVDITYPFVALGYWAFAYTMSKESRRIETRLGVGVR